MIYTQDEIDQFDQDTCNQKIKKLDKTYNLNKTVTHYTDQIDIIVNQLIALEMRIEKIKQLEQIDHMNSVRFQDRL